MVSAAGAGFGVAVRRRAQYQSWPRRCRVRSRLPHPAHHGGQIAVAPAARSASSRSPTARGAPGTGRRGAPRDGRARAAARRRDFARPPATAVTTARTLLRGQARARPPRPAPRPTRSGRTLPGRGARARSRRRSDGVDAGPLGAQVAEAGLGTDRLLRPAEPVSPAPATGSISSSIEQSRMSSSAIRIFRLSRSGRSTTSR